MEGGLLFAIRVCVFLLLLTPLIVTQSTFFPFIVGKAIYSRSLIEVILGLWLILILFYPRYRPPRSWILVLFALFLSISLIAAFLGVSPQRSIWSNYERMQGVFDLAHWFALVVVLGSVFKGFKEWKPLLNFNLGVSLVMALLGIAEYHNVKLLPFFTGGGRVSITLNNPTYVGAYMLVNFFIALAFLAHSFDILPVKVGKRPRKKPPPEKPPALPWKLFWGGVAILNLWVLMLSGTRGAFVGLVFALFAAAIIYAIWGRHTLLKKTALGLSSVILALVIIFALFKDTTFISQIVRINITLERLVATTPALEGRLVSVQTGFRAFLEKPLLGWGPENFLIAFDHHLSEKHADIGGFFDQAHNKPLEVLTTTGIFGLIAYLSIWLAILGALVRRFKEKPDEELFTLFMGAALLGYFVQNLFLFDTPATVLQMMLLVGWVTSLDNLKFPAKMSVRSPSIRPQVRVGMAIAILLLISLSLYYLNYRPYRAAQYFIAPARSLEERIELAQKSFNTFPPLATLPRRIFFQLATIWWDHLNPPKRGLLLEFVEAEAPKAINAEPQNPRIYLALSQFYLKASAADLRYLEKADQYLKKAQELSPNRREVRGLLAARKKLKIEGG